MMSLKPVVRAFVLSSMAALPALAGDSPCAIAKGDFTSSFPTFPIPAGERIVGFEIVLQGARVVHIDDLPKGWSLKVEPDDPNRQKVSGAMQTASESLRVATELPTLHAVREASGTPPAPFDLEGTVYTSTDSKTYVRHRFECGELAHATPVRR